MKFITGDHHFHHKNIIRYASRPFSSVEEMDETLIKNWNDTVKKEDVVYYLGDFAFAKLDEIKRILSSLNGYKILICGNHDKTPVEMFNAGFDEVHKKFLVVGNKFLIHFPFYVKDMCTINVGVDVTGYKPIPLPSEEGIYCAHVHDKWRWRINGQQG